MLLGIQDKEEISNFDGVRQFQRGVVQGLHQGLPIHRSYCQVYQDDIVWSQATQEIQAEVKEEQNVDQVQI